MLLYFKNSKNYFLFSIYKKKNHQTNFKFLKIFISKINLLTIFIK